MPWGYPDRTWRDRCAILHAGGALTAERVRELDQDIIDANAALGPPRDHRDAEQRRLANEAEMVRRIMKKAWP